MSDSKHTPGSWWALGVHIYSPMESSPVALVRNERDAPIVAAAPRMLDALITAELTLRRSDNRMAHQVVCEAIAAGGGRVIVDV